jgi:hypothetical protein
MSQRIMVHVDRYIRDGARLRFWGVAGSAAALGVGIGCILNGLHHGNQWEAFTGAALIALSANMLCLARYVDLLSKERVAAMRKRPPVTSTQTPPSEQNQGENQSIPNKEST